MEPPPPPPSPPHTLTFSGVLSTSKTIILSNYFHFLTLSFFFLPLSLSLITTPTLYHHQNHLLPYLLYTIIIHTFTLCAIATITFSTNRSFSGDPINISDSLKSLISSFLPLASTAILAYVLIAFILLTFILFIATVLMLVHNLGYVIDYNSVYFMWFSIIMGTVLIMIVLYVHVEWSLAFVVAVVESKWGFAALIRSAYLVKGMRSVSLLVMLYFGVFSAIMVWLCYASFFYLTVILGSFFLTMMLLRITAANTVLYNYCKALHGELAVEVDDNGFDHEYMSLGVDDEKVPRVVAVVVA